jgi:hypothetical protein
MTKGGFFAAGTAAFAGLVVLVVVGFAFVVLSAIYAVFAAIAAVAVLMIIESRTDWTVTQDSLGYVFAFILAFLIAGGVGTAIDIVFQTHFSVPGMGGALDLTQWVAARREPLIRNVPDYYEFALGSTPARWLRFAGFQVVTVLAFAAVLIRIPAEPEIEPDPPRTRVLKLVAVSAIAVASAAVTVFPLTIWALIALRDRSPFGKP